MGILRSVAEGIADSLRHVEEGMFVLNLPTSLQFTDYSCGVECVYAVLSFYGARTSRRTVARMLGVCRVDGVNEDSIMRVLEEFNLPHRVMEEGTIEELDAEVRARRPTIVALDEDDHWAVVYGTAPSFIMLMDPDPRRIFQTSPTEEELYERWDGWGIVVG